MPTPSTLAAEDEQTPCRATTDGIFVCSKERHHLGPHQAKDSGGVLLRSWKNERPTRPICGKPTDKGPCNDFQGHLGSCLMMDGDEIVGRVVEEVDSLRKQLHAMQHCDQCGEPTGCTAVICGACTKVGPEVERLDDAMKAIDIYKDGVTKLTQELNQHRADRDTAAATIKALQKQVENLKANSRSAAGPVNEEERNGYLDALASMGARMTEALEAHQRVVTANNEYLEETRAQRRTIATLQDIKIKSQAYVQAHRRYEALLEAGQEPSDFVIQELALAEGDLHKALE